jgi:hypothetical protein
MHSRSLAGKKSPVGAAVSVGLNWQRTVTAIDECLSHNKSNRGNPK